MPKPQPYRTTSRKVLAKTKLFSLEEHHRIEEGTGKQADFTLLLVPDWINVVAITTEGKFILVEQFRHGTEKNELEFVGGIIEPDEPPIEAALRELREETGYVPSDTSIIKQIGAARPNPAFMNNMCYTYLVTDCIDQGEQDLDEYEAIEVSLADEEELIEKIRSGEIDHSLVLNAYLWYRLNDGATS